MNSLESVRTLIKDYLKALASGNASETYYYYKVYLLKVKDFEHKVYDAFFNLISDPTQSPESILHLLDTHTTGLDGFSSSVCLQALIGFACVEALSIRMPNILNGPWESLVWMIVNYLSFANDKGLTAFRFKKPNKATLTFIVKLVSPELCPNPCLRLELFRFLKIFNCRYLYYDRESYRNNIIETLFEICDDYTPLTVDQLPNFSPTDFQFLMEENSINIGFIMNDCEVKTKQSKIIATVFKLTMNFALLEKEKHQRGNNQEIVDGFWLGNDIGKQLSTCLSFCGLMSEEGFIFIDAGLHDLVKFVGNDSLLLNYMIDTVETIEQISNCVDNFKLRHVVCGKKERLFHALLKGHIQNIPAFLRNQEICGGITPAVEYRLRYFQNNGIDQELYQDSDYGSETYVSDESDDTYPFDIEGNDSEIYFSD